MEIVLLVAILAVGASALFVAFTFRNHVTQNLELARKSDLEPLARKADLPPLITEAAGDISGRAAGVGEDMRRQLHAAAESQGEQVAALRDELNGKLDKLDRQVSQLGTYLARQRELMAGIENQLRGQETQGVDPQEMDALESALLQAEAYVAERDGWDQPPRLFSLATKSSLVAADPELAAGLADAAPDALIPVLQDLPPGEPFDVLATIGWSEDVLGCVLVTGILALPPEAEKDAPGDPAAMDDWAQAHPGGQRARLAVGVTRTGAYQCGLRLEGADDIQVGADLADDLVAALLGTF